MINTLDEAIRQIRDFGVEELNYTLKSLNYDDSQTIIIEVRFNEDLMKVLVANSNHISYLPHVDGQTRYISFNTMRGTDPFLSLY